MNLKEDIELTVERLKALPEEIYRAHKSVNDSSRTQVVADLEKRVELIEAELMLEISEETQDGKKKFTNDSNRKAELLKRLSLSREYQEIQSEILNLESQKKEAQAQLVKLEAELSTQKALANLFAQLLPVEAAMNVITGSVVNTEKKEVIENEKSKNP
jgi:multidrug efflux pump subunit AcrA (membrane-fusion protein)